MNLYKPNASKPNVTSLPMIEFLKKLVKAEKPSFNGVKIKFAPIFIDESIACPSKPIAPCKFVARLLKDLPNLPNDDLTVERTAVVLFAIDDLKDLNAPLIEPANTPILLLRAFKGYDNVVLILSCKLEEFDRILFRTLVLPFPTFAFMSEFVLIVLSTFSIVSEGANFSLPIVNA